MVRFQFATTELILLLVMGLRSQELGDRSNSAGLPPGSLPRFSELRQANGVLDLFSCRLRVSGSYLAIPVCSTPDIDQGQQKKRQRSWPEDRDQLEPVFPDFLMVQPVEVSVGKKEHIVIRVLLAKLFHALLRAAHRENSIHPNSLRPGSPCSLLPNPLTALPGSVRPKMTKSGPPRPSVQTPFYAEILPRLRRALKPLW